MKTKLKNNGSPVRNWKAAQNMGRRPMISNGGSVLLITIFVIALLATLVSGMLVLNTEEIQVMRNQIYAAQALAIAEAGLNDAFAQLRADNQWDDGFDSKSFDDGEYTVTVSDALPNLTIQSQGTSSQGFLARVEADITVGSSSPHMIRIDNLRINEE